MVVEVYYMQQALQLLVKTGTVLFLSPRASGLRQKTHKYVIDCN